MPSTRAELDLSGEWCTTLDREKFVLANDGVDDKIVIFATENSLRLLAEATTYFVDETFSVCLPTSKMSAKPYGWLLGIHMVPRPSSCLKLWFYWTHCCDKADNNYKGTEIIVCVLVVGLGKDSLCAFN